MKVIRNFCFLLSLLDYVFVAILVRSLCGFSDNIYATVFFVVIAIGLAFFNVSPSFKKNEGQVDYDNSFDEFYENFLVVENTSSRYQLFVRDEGYVFKRIVKDADMPEKADYIDINSLDKKDIFYSFSNINSVTFTGSDELGESGTLTFDHGKKNKFKIIGFASQECIDKYFENVKYKKKSVRNKEENSHLYGEEVRKPIALISYFSKLALPYTVIPLYFMGDAQKPWYYCLFASLGIVGMIITVFINVVFPLVAVPNKNSKRDDYDVIGESVVVSIIIGAIVAYKCIDITYTNLLYSVLILVVPALIFAFVIYSLNQPKTEVEKLTRIFTAATSVLFIVLFVNSLHYTDVTSVNGTVNSLSTGRNENYITVTDENGNRDNYDIVFNKNRFDVDDKVLIEKKKGVLGIRTEEIYLRD